MHDGLSLPGAPKHLATPVVRLGPRTVRPSWTDPVIGLRGRFNLNKTFYLIAQTDVGGFGIGSDIAVEAYAALGYQFTRNIFFRGRLSVLL
jgi:hypothetical protein